MTVQTVAELLGTSSTTSAITSARRAQRTTLGRRLPFRSPETSEQAR